MVIEHDVMPESEWDKYPAKPQKPIDTRYDSILDDLASGKIVRVTTETDGERRGLRLALGRRAKQRGFSIETRVLGDTLAIRKSGDAPTQEAEESPTPRPRSRRKQESVPTQEG